MDVFKAYATDKAKETKGVKFELPEEGASLQIASTNSAEFQKELAKISATLRKARQNNDDASEKAVVQLYAKHILVGWEGLTFKGEPLQYNRPNAEILLDMGEFFALVNEFAGDADNYRHESEEEVGNSLPSS